MTYERRLRYAVVAASHVKNAVCMSMAGLFAMSHSEPAAMGMGKRKAKVRTVCISFWLCMIRRGLRNHASVVSFTRVMPHYMSILPKPQCHMRTAIVMLRISGANLATKNISLFKKSPPCSRFRVSTLNMVSRSSAPDTQSRTSKPKSLMKTQSISKIHFLSVICFGV